MRSLLVIDWPPVIDAMMVKVAACVASAYVGAVLIARIDARRAASRLAPAEES